METVGNTVPFIPNPVKSLYSDNEQTEYDDLYGGEVLQAADQEYEYSKSANKADC